MAQVETSDKPSSRAPRRGLRSTGKVLAALAVLAAVAVGIAIALPKLSLSFSKSEPNLYVVKRADYVHDILARGNLESASNVEVRCMVQTRIGGGGVRSAGGFLNYTPSFKAVKVKRTSGVDSANDKGGGSSSSGSGGSGGGSSGSSSGGGGGSSGSGGSGGGGSSSSSGSSSSGGGMIRASRSALGGSSSFAGGSGYSSSSGSGSGSSGNRSGGYGGSRGGGGGGGTMVLEVIPEGTYVQPGDVLARLDSSALEAQLVQQQINCNTSEADVIRARNNYEMAQIAKQEYLEGQYVQDKQSIESDIFVAEEDKRRAQQYLEYSKQLKNRDYITALQVQNEAFNAQQSERDVKAAKIDLMVLDDYVRVMAVKQLDADIQTAEAVLRTQERSHQLDQERLALIQKQIDNCTIRAPSAGQVVYVNDVNRMEGQEVIIEEGATVRERQIMFRLPDPKRMLVKSKIDEAQIGLVAKGMKVKIRLDAFPDKELTGVVEKIADYPVANSFFSSSVKQYETIITIDGSPEGLRPGLTTDVEIRVRQLPGVVQVPVQAILQHEGKNYCILHENPDDWRLREVKLGVSNDKVVVIEDGLQEGERVVLGTGQYRAKVRLPGRPSALSDAATTP